MEVFQSHMIGIWFCVELWRQRTTTNRTTVLQLWMSLKQKPDFGKTWYMTLSWINQVSGKLSDILGETPLILPMLRVRICWSQNGRRLFYTVPPSLKAYFGTWLPIARWIRWIESSAVHDSGVGWNHTVKFIPVCYKTLKKKSQFCDKPVAFSLLIAIAVNKGLRLQMQASERRLSNRECGGFISLLLMLSIISF